MQNLQVGDLVVAKASMHNVSFFMVRRKLIFIVVSVLMFTGLWRVVISILKKEFWHKKYLRILL
jgi:hypothetical protein